MTADTGERHPLAPFSDGVLETAARERDVPETDLRDALVEHQRSVRSLPGVDDIVYEWRRTLPRDPLVERRSDAYFLAVDPAVWAEFVDALDLSVREGEALAAVYEAQLAASLGGEAVPRDGRVVVVLTRP